MHRKEIRTTTTKKADAEIARTLDKRSERAELYYEETNRCFLLLLFLFRTAIFLRSLLKTTRKGTLSIESDTGKICT